MLLNSWKQVTKFNSRYPFHIYKNIQNLSGKRSDNDPPPPKKQGSSVEPKEVAYITIMALFGSHLQLTITLQYQLPFLVIFTTGYSVCSSGGAHTPTQTRIFNHKRDVSRFLPFESFAASPPLYFWGAPMKMPPTYCHVGNKKRFFYSNIYYLERSPLFGYIVSPLPGSRGIDNASSL